MSGSRKLKPSAVLARLRRRTPYGSLAMYCSAHGFSFARAGSILIGRLPTGESASNPHVVSILRAWMRDGLIESPLQIGINARIKNAIIADNHDFTPPRAIDYARGAHFLPTEGDS